MARMRRYASNAERQAAYRSRLREAPTDALYLPALCPLSSVPSTARWKMAIDLAARLLGTVAEEMQDYSDQRSDRWHEGDTAERFHENLDQVEDIHSQLDDLKSNFYLTQS
jgi:hypothetical protein